MLENVITEGVAGIVKVKTADARDIPFPDGYFDVVASVFTLHNVNPGRANAVSEMLRVLKSGGMLLIADANLWRTKNLLVKEGVEILQVKKVHFFPSILTARKRDADDRTA